MDRGRLLTGSNPLFKLHINETRDRVQSMKIYKIPFRAFISNSEHHRCIGSHPHLLELPPVRTET